jgi:hypothetical protein
MTTTDDALSPYVRQEIYAIMDEVNPLKMTLDELLALLGLMTAVRQRIRADRADELRLSGSASRAPLKLVHPVADGLESRQ